MGKQATRGDKLFLRPQGTIKRDTYFGQHQTTHSVIYPFQIPQHIIFLRPVYHLPYTSSQQ